MARSCIDLATKETDARLNPDQAPTKNLYDRIEKLINERAIPDRLGGLAHSIRKDGNDGAHDGTLSEAESDDLIDFVTVLLQELYTQPKNVEKAEERTAKRRADRNRK